MTSDITAITALVVALGTAVPAIILAIKGKSKADAVSTTVDREVTRADKQDTAIADLQNKVNGGGETHS